MSGSEYNGFSGDKGVFCHLDFKFFAKIIRNTENFSNFPLKRICQHHSGIASKKAKSATFSDIRA